MLGAFRIEPNEIISRVLRIIRLIVSILPAKAAPRTNWMGDYNASTKQATHSYTIATACLYKFSPDPLAWNHPFRDLVSINRRCVGSGSASCREVFQLQNNDRNYAWLAISGLQTHLQLTYGSCQCVTLYDWLLRFSHHLVTLECQICHLCMHHRQSLNNFSGPCKALCLIFVLGLGLLPGALSCNHGAQSDESETIMWAASPTPRVGLALRRESKSFVSNTFSGRHDVIFNTDQSSNELELKGSWDWETLAFVIEKHRRITAALVSLRGCQAKRIRCTPTIQEGLIMRSTFDP